MTLLSKCFACLTVSAITASATALLNHYCYTSICLSLTGCVTLYLADRLRSAGASE